MQIIEYTTIGLHLSRHGAAEVNLTEELDPLCYFAKEMGSTGVSSSSTGGGSAAGGISASTGETSVGLDDPLVNPSVSG